MNDFTVGQLAVLDITMRELDTLVAARPFHSVSLRIDGEGAEFEIEGRRVSARVGDVVYMPAGTPYHLRTSRDRILAVNFSLTGAEPHPFALMTPRDVAPFHEAFSSLLRVWNEKAAGFDLRAKSLLYRIFADLALESSLSRESGSRHRISAAIERLHRDFTDPALTVAHLADLCHMSDTWFRHLFTEVCGKSPHAYLADLRLSRAAELLASGLYSVADVAYLSGFSDAKYFSTAFSRRIGKSPFAYKKQH